MVGIRYKAYKKIFIKRTNIIFDTDLERNRT